MPGSGISDWRMWTSQQELAGTPFPGQGPINDAEILSNFDPLPVQAITGITTANPGVVTVPAHGFFTGQYVVISGVLGATQANGIWLVTVLTANTFSIPVNVTGTFGAGTPTVQETGLMPITALGPNSIPTYPYSPTGVNAVDPFSGWSTQKEQGPPVTITGVTTANPGVVTAAGHGLVTGDIVVIAGVAGAIQANGTWAVTVLTASTFSIPVNVSGTYSGSGSTVRKDDQRPAVTGITS